ncbi:phosphoribosylglycinamide formyltransferase [Rhizobium sp. SSA_523]|uniref:phosphoribosylglycinamide formyltransferase n=1 Tax=Rhizobium sp. SSA_523 TaxID=2952477 RepID=UPI00209157E6|nr:phosphoribosylglycinamide formyltransferase [Rhizobium sp. SSA_523]MCO5730728.1 phosphoribosylglycinamide formyltransferase [Rhizobium sp. SSA_523]WKC24448.1 phosphoribosylglycinamide formyltransferase [Rhizobium sp. SSA_523]
MSPARKRVVVLISGSGSNMEALAEACSASDFPAEIVGVISDKAAAGGLAKAEARNIASLALERKDYASKPEHEAAVLQALAELKPDIICLAGYMRLLSAEFIRPYEGRILNIHPSLLPLFAGLHTHRRALDAGVRVTGCTVHFVTEGMDEGPCIAQAVVPVLPQDTEDSLAARVLTVEHRTYPLALRLVAEGRVRMAANGRVERDGANVGAEEMLISA